MYLTQQFNNKMLYQIISASSVHELQSEVNNFLLQNGMYNLSGGISFGEGGCHQVVYKIDFSFGNKELLID